MKGVILAGGSGSRLAPLTKVVNKHLLPVGKYPMIFYPLIKMIECGIQEILVISGCKDLGMIAGVLGDGGDFGVSLTYRVQERPGGIAEALSLGTSFVGTDHCLVILGDNIFSASLSSAAVQFPAPGEGARIFLKQVSDPARYGVAELEDNQVVKIVEKPANPSSNYCVTGIYLYDQQVFEIIRSLRPSGRGELEITDVNNYYLKEGKLGYAILDGWWIDAGTFDSIQQAGVLVRDSSPFTTNSNYCNRL